jgi:hypothetical protein
MHKLHLPYRPQQFECHFATVDAFNETHTEYNNSNGSRYFYET